jgi:hypothetical protein
MQVVNENLQELRENSLFLLVAPAGDKLFGMRGPNGDDFVRAWSEKSQQQRPGARHIPGAQRLLFGSTCHGFWGGSRC